MSELHFDADGEATKVPADAEELRVRRFRKPGERGACEVVHGADGAPLYVPVDATYLEFRKLVDNVPGRYRLDPVDASHRPCGHAVPCYVTIEATRNAAGAADDRDSLFRELLRANVEMMRANVEITKNVTDRLSTMMTATAEILRAADGAGLPRREPLPPAPAADDQDGADNEDEEEDDDESGNPLADTVAHFLQQAMPLLETYLADRMAARRKAESAAASSPAAAPAPAAQTAAPAPSAAAPTTPPGPAAPSNSVTPASPSPAPTASASAAPTDAPAATGGEVRNAAPDSAPTPEQLQHLIAVKAKLTPQEQRVVMTAIPRMEPAARAHWLGELCALPVDQAAELVRSMMPPLRTKKAPTS